MDNTIYSDLCHRTNPLSRIGAGFCGSVWSDPSNRAVAIKREDGGPGRSLRNDSNIHQQLIAAQDRRKSSLTFAIPSWHCYVTANAARDIVARFPSGYSSCNILLTERIPPLPAHVRGMLIEKYCPRELAHSISTDPRNHDCLIRPYLGRRRRGFNNTVFSMFSLRNHPLHLDQIEDLGLDLFTYSRQMAEALAFMHWCAGIDANDVEFVLTPLSPGMPTQKAIPSSVLGDHRLWILDFDCCRPMTMDESGIEHAAAAFWRNDPYYPRPGKEQERDVELWALFKRAFLNASASFIGRDDAHLPELLVERIEARAAS
ncbi:zinc finger protein-domain-containing protein [Xylariaceae sp. FL1272]|nr:zinc finger protein-domain-containing protein [Xylariaceae sp. FL1272]